jgi:hypothetical protein
VNPTGFRVEGLHAGAKLPGTTTSPALAITHNAGQITISWPVSASDFKLFTTANLTAPQWAAVQSGIVVSGDQNTYTVQGTSPSGFYRLQK